MAFSCDNVSGSYPPCQVLCSFSTNGGRHRNFDELVDKCCSNQSSECYNCVKYYLNSQVCNLYVSPSSASCSVYDTLVVEPGDFSKGDFIANAEGGFIDFLPVFFSIFGVFLIVRIFTMAFK